MEIFGIGPQELFFIVLIAIIVLGPKDMQKAGKTVGRWLNQVMRSDGWKAFQRASKEIRSLPTNLMREANLEELQQMDREIRNSIDPRPPASRPPRQQPPANQAAPPAEPLSSSPEPPATPPSEAAPPADNTGQEQQ
jgi:sec-independent protein translocase protein TatB